MGFYYPHPVSFDIRHGQVTCEHKRVTSTSRELTASLRSILLFPLCPWDWQQWLLHYLDPGVRKLGRKAAS